MRANIFLFMFLAYRMFVISQVELPDTFQLPVVTIEGTRMHLQQILPTYITTGKKVDIIEMKEVQFSLSEKYGRQVFATIPGVFVYDMDGTGNQMNIAVRGLDPHRNWEFNVRKDGIITNTDMYGYPASHYNVPLEAVHEIILISGTSALQYGAQFGGMLNFITKQPDPNRPFAFETINTVGSYDLSSTFNRIHGTLGKFQYSAWLFRKSLSGYRQFNNSRQGAEAITLFYHPTKRMQFIAEWTRSSYFVQIPGPLNDSMFRADPRQATRQRNFYAPNIHVPSVQMKWTLDSLTHIHTTVSAILGDRYSILFDKPASIPDTINHTTMQYNHRDLHIDYYKSYIAEARLKRSFFLFRLKHDLVIGLQYMNNTIHREQGKGSPGLHYDISLYATQWTRDVRYHTSNIAFFAEQLINITKRLSITGGIRYEYGLTTLTGTLSYYDAEKFKNKIPHQFPLFGTSVQYAPFRNIILFAGMAQSYRPVLLKDIIPANSFEVVDKNLKDIFGYTAEAGIRGNIEKIIIFSLSSFQIVQNNRMGAIVQIDTANNLYVFRTNIGDSRTRGIESFVRFSYPLNEHSSINLFNSTSFMDGRYTKGLIRSGNQNVDITGNKVESVPRWIIRNGFTFNFHTLTLSALHSFVDETFADPLNTVEPNTSGTVGKVPSYHLFDAVIALQINKHYRLQFSAHNIFDKQYFTKRPLFYPGPGIWPSDGRAFSMTISAQF